MSTADEVRCIQRQSEAWMKERSEALHDTFVRPCMEATICYGTLGFFVRHNRSPKRLARLKQSLCDLTINNLPRWEIK